MLMVAYDDPLSTVVAIANGFSIVSNSSITVHSAPSGSKLRITLSWLSSNTAQRAFHIVVLMHVQVYPTAAAFVVKYTWHWLTCENVPLVYEHVPTHEKQTQVAVPY